MENLRQDYPGESALLSHHLAHNHHPQPGPGRVIAAARTVLTLGHLTSHDSTNHHAATTALHRACRSAGSALSTDLRETTRYHLDKLGMSSAQRHKSPPTHSPGPRWFCLFRAGPGTRRRAARPGRKLRRPRAGFGRARSPATACEPHGPLTGTGLRLLSGRYTPTSLTRTGPPRPRRVALTEPAGRWTRTMART